MPYVKGFIILNKLFKGKKKKSTFNSNSKVSCKFTLSK